MPADFGFNAGIISPPNHTKYKSRFDDISGTMSQKASMLARLFGSNQSIRSYRSNVNTAMADSHVRMPVILEPKQWDKWLDLEILARCSQRNVEAMPVRLAGSGGGVDAGEFAAE
jgi:hypothetical protein